MEGSSMIAKFAAAVAGDGDRALANEDGVGSGHARVRKPGQPQDRGRGREEARPRVVAVMAQAKEATLAAEFERLEAALARSQMEVRDLKERLDAETVYL